MAIFAYLKAIAVSSDSCVAKSVDMLRATVFFFTRIFKTFANDPNIAFWKGS